MCTLTWLIEPNGYSLVFNRDELKTRQRALPPTLHTSETGVSFLSPTDTDAGGSWLAVNQFGITICLLNNYQAPEPLPRHTHSRGEIVRTLATCSSLVELRMQLTSMSLSSYRGFDLVVFDGGITQFCWDTRELQEREPVQPLTSSSFKGGQVCEARSKYYASLGPITRIEQLEAFHASHIDDKLQPIEGVPTQALSVCVHRSDAETVSQCQVVVRPDRVSIGYRDGSPCTAPLGAWLELQRMAAA